ncbi:hypothetical protein BJ878DRAFT_536092 [Calycina marina]|uniref:Wax synthase domain-containing protein n=1 Tax=Calycina marina TaxID=1763456 RepID=A0A9P7YY78_9HELO|nr:hypothetical protein BJ878DRAFT_536092 [Calycina marina]
MLNSVERNSSYPLITIIPIVENIPPAIDQLSHDAVKVAAFLLIPAELMYFAIYSQRKGLNRVYNWLTGWCLLSLWTAPVVAPVAYGPAQCLQNLAFAIGTMKILDVWARRNSLPTYATPSKTPPDWKLSLLLLIELRYESFKPNHVRVPKDQENFTLPQIFPTVLAFELVLRYKSSSALFGPLYLADSLSGFWSETWHNAFAAQFTSLAYSPLRHGLPQYGVPTHIACSLGVFGAFGLMAIFHMFALRPILSNVALVRVGVFFFLNGVATVAKVAVWGKRKYWMKAVLAWVFEMSMATWAASGIEFPNGLSKIPWREFSDA